MANMVLSFGDGKAQKAEKEVYVDLSLDRPRISHSTYDISRTVNVRAVQNSLMQIFTWTPGERIINPEFGNNLHRYLYEGITDFNIEAVMAEIRNCVSQWEPRVSIDRVVNIQSVEGVENNTIRLDIYYRIPGLTDEQFVYSYYPTSAGWSPV